MALLKYYLIGLSLVLCSRGFSQMQVNRTIQLTGSGANAKVSGIQQYDQLNDAVNAQGIQYSAPTFSMAGGAPNTINITLSPVPAAYIAGMAVQFVAAANNTDSVTLNVNNLGAIDIKKNVLSNLIPCDIAAGQVVTVIYDGANFQMTSPPFSGAASAASAGPDQLSVPGTSTILAATAPVNGTGSWAIISGTGGAVANPSNPTSSFSGTLGNSYTLTWTVSPVCGNSNVDTVIISFVCPTSAANAGPDQLNISGTSTTLGAATPANGAGTWAIISGTGGVVASPSNPTSSFSGIADSIYTLTWTVSPVCASSDIDTVIISFANAFTCGSSATDASGNVYNTVLIGSQCWLQSNLETTKYQDGSNISSSDMVQWGVNGAPSCTASNFNGASCGILYDGNVFENPVSPCPVGFHVPNENEFITLVSSVSNNTQQLFALGAGCPSNCSGFNTYICGQIDDGGWEGCGAADQIYYWTEPISSEIGWITQFNSSNGGVSYNQLTSHYLTNYNYSFRCVQ